MSLETGTTGSREALPRRAVTAVFDFDPKPYAAAYRNRGYVHIAGGVTRAFIEFARDALQAYQTDESKRLADWEIKNKKQQYLFEFPPDNKLLREAMDTVAAVTGMAPERVTLSERHLKVYAANAHPTPPPHKDRFASRVAVGIPLSVPARSAVVLYPDQSREVNHFDSAEDWRNSFSPPELPETALKDVEPTKLTVDVGDAVIFEGSTIYHERVHGANAVLLYLKFNDMRLDPLGEDPFVAEQRQASLATLANVSDAALLQCILDVSPRLVRVSRHYSRYNWREVLQGQVAGEKPFSLSEDDLALLRRSHGRQTVRQVLADMGVPQTKMQDHLSRIRRLGAHGAIDIIQ